MFNAILWLLFFQAHAETAYRLENYLFYSNNVLADSGINPDNQVLNLPAETLAADIRAELKWKGEQNQIVIRPRYQAERRRIIALGATSDKSESDWDLTDAFWETQLSQDISITTGLQVYQWGPAELMNPSNPLFHFNNRQKSFGYKEKGKVLIRGNYTVGRADNFVVILEPVSNNEPPWLEGEFTPKAVIKYEHQSEQSTGLFGFVAGQEEKEVKFFGTYFNWQVSESTSIYADGKVTEQEAGYTTEQNGGFWNLVRPTAQERTPVLAVSGIRCEGEFDVRFEYIHNSAGYSEAEWEKVLSSVVNPLNPDYKLNVSRFQNLGLELPGRDYLYFSYRVTEPFEVKDFNIYFRVLYSMQDDSSQMQFEFDKAIGDSWIMFGSVTAATGRKEAEFRLLNTWQTLVGVKWVL